MNYKMTYKDGNTDREHRFVAEIKLGRHLTKDEVVHHIDGNKRNNNPDNLIVVTRSEHARIHAQTISRAKPVRQIDKYGNTINQWKSAAIEGRTLGITPSNISACCNGRLKRAGGFSWEFV